MYRLISSTRISGAGEIARSNQHFRNKMLDSGNMLPKYGKVLVTYESKKRLEKLFNI